MDNSPVSGSTTSVPPVPPGTSNWILLVDDEQAILNLVETVLIAHGHAVRVAKNAEEANATIDAASAPPKLLICDVLMPGIDGLEMTRRLVARLPRLKVIFISGHLADISWWPADLCDYRFLAKPFTNAQLSMVVTEVLEERGAGG